MTMQNDGAGSARQEPIRRGIRKWFAKGAVAKVLVVAILFGTAGRIDWVWGWAYVGAYVLFDLLTAAVLLRTSPELLARRAEVQEGTKGWDRALVMIAAGWAPMASWVVGGLDARYGWTRGMPVEVQVGALVVSLLGYGLVVWAMGANAHFEATVRIQKDRDHKVATGGPYAIIRHPGYVGSILFVGAGALMLGSFWALIPGAASAIAFVVRTALEDRTLRDELPGYEAYAARVRYRLLPGVW